MKHGLFTFISVLIFVSGTAFAHDTIKGKVVDRKGNPVVGTRITLKDGGIATTDFDGAFEIEASEKEKAVANCVGMQQKKVKMKDDMVIKLTKTTSWNRKPTKFSPFVLLQGGWVPGNDKALVGLKVGMVKKAGWYVSFNISTDDLAGKTKHDVVSLGHHDWSKDYWYDKESYGGAFRQVSAGAIFRLGCPLHLLVGFGVCDSVDYYDLYPDASGKTHRIEVEPDWGRLEHSLDLGFMLSFKHFTMDLSTSFLWGAYIPVFNCGVGYKF